MTKRKNRPYPRLLKRRRVEPHTRFAFVYFILGATLALWTYLITKFV